MSIVPGGLARRCSPTYTPSPYHFWRGLVLYASGFMPLVAAAAGLLAITIWGDFSTTTLSQEWFVLMAAGGLAFILVWWWSVTGTMVRARTPRRAERVAGYLLIPLDFALAMLAGAAVGAVAFLPLYAVIDIVQHLSGSGG